MIYENFISLRIEKLQKNVFFDKLIKKKIYIFYVFPYIYFLKNFEKIFFFFEISKNKNIDNLSKFIYKNMKFNFKKNLFYFSRYIFFKVSEAISTGHLCITFNAKLTMSRSKTHIKRQTTKIQSMLVAFIASVACWLLE